MDGIYTWHLRASVELVDAKIVFENEIVRGVISV